MESAVSTGCFVKETEPLSTSHATKFKRNLTTRVRRRVSKKRQGLFEDYINFNFYLTAKEMLDHGCCSCGHMTCADRTHAEVEIIVPKP